MRDIQMHTVEGVAKPFYFDGKSYHRVPKEDLILRILQHASPWPLGNSDIQAALKRHWGVEMTSSHIRYHMKKLADAGQVQQVRRGKYSVGAKQ